MRLVEILFRRLLILALFDLKLLGTGTLVEYARLRQEDLNALLLANLLVCNDYVRLPLEPLDIKPPISQVIRHRVSVEW